MKKYVLLSWLWIWMGGQLLWAGNDPSLTGARGLSLGKAYTGIRGDLWTLSYNPAGIAYLPQMQVGGYAERRFGMKELVFGGVAFATPLREHHFLGVEVSSFGFSNYKETKIGATYATNILKVISLGTKINYANLAVQDLGSTSAVWLDLGINVPVAKQLTFGASAYNVTQTKIRTESGKQNIPTVLTTGFAYTPSDKVTIVGDVQKDLTRPVSFRGGVEYKFYKDFYARVGAATRPTLVTFGAGWRYKEMLSIDFASTLHNTLGFTPALSLTYNFGKKTQKEETE